MKRDEDEAEEPGRDVARRKNEEFMLHDTHASLAVPDVDRAVLAEAAIPTVGLPPEDPWLVGDMLHRAMVSDAVALADVADALGVTAGRLRQVIGERPDGRAELFGVRDSRGRWRVFAYQFADDGLVARDGRSAQRHLPVGMDPAAVRSWWDTPNAGCYHHGTELTPRQWLAAGLDPDHLAAVAAHDNAV